MNANYVSSDSTIISQIFVGNSPREFLFLAFDVLLKQFVKLHFIKMMMQDAMAEVTMRKHSRKENSDLFFFVSQVFCLAILWLIRFNLLLTIFVHDSMTAPFCLSLRNYGKTSKFTQFTTIWEQTMYAQIMVILSLEVKVKITFRIDELWEKITSSDSDLLRRERVQAPWMLL